MLVKLTNKCYENCSHCMECSNPDGEHMSWSVLQDTVSFLNSNKAQVVSLSGGELTTDPEFYEKVTYVSNKCSCLAITIQSNGSFIFDTEKTKRVREILKIDKVRVIQISTHKKYYPNYDAIMSKKDELESLSSKVLFVSDWQGKLTSIQRLGRAVNLKDEEFKGNPSCSPIISRANQAEKIFNKVPKLSEFLEYLTMSNYVCKPMINEYGIMYVGECQFCSKIGDVNGFKSLSIDQKEKVNDKIMSTLMNLHMCDKCGEVKNLSGKVPNSVLTTKCFK